MKKSTFFKTLLLAAGLLGGSSAWADERVQHNLIWKRTQLKQHHGRRVCQVCVLLVHLQQTLL